MTPLSLDRYCADLRRVDPLRWRGVVTDVTGLLIESQGPASAIGGFCEIQTARGRRVRTQVARFSQRAHSLDTARRDRWPGAGRRDLCARRRCACERRTGSARARARWFWPAHRRRAAASKRLRNTICSSTPPGPLEREHITEPLVTGIRAIDSLLPCGLGQRIGLYGGSGVGKSTLLGAMSRQNSADVSVVALIGERNREVRHFLENELGAEGRARTVVVAATSDRPAPVARARLFCRSRYRGIFSRSRKERAARGGFRHASGDGAARNWSGGR